MGIEVSKQMEGLTFADEAQRKAFEAVLTANEETMSRRYLRREEGTRLAQAKQAAEQAAATALAAVESEKQLSVNHMKALEQWKVEEAERLKQEASAEVTRFKSELRARGIDPDSITGREMQDRNLDEFRRETPPDMTKFRAELGKEFLDVATARSIAQTAIDLPFQTMTVMEEVKQLYGAKPIDYAGFQEAARTGLMKGISVKDTAEQFFKLPDVRQEQWTANKEKELRAQLETEYQERMAKMQVPGFAGAVNVQSDDKIFTPEFANQTKGGGNANDPNFNEARDHFLQVNAELAASGTSMLKG